VKENGYIMSKYNVKKAAKTLNMNEATLLKHMETFLYKFDQNYQYFHKTVESGEYSDIEFQFHRIKSTFKMLSANKAAKICQKAVNGSRKHKDLPYEDYLNQICFQIEMLREVI
jgi:hypothetical protein